MGMAATRSCRRVSVGWPSWHAVGQLLKFYLGQGAIAKARKWIKRRAGSAQSGYAGRAASLLDPTLVRDTDLDERITQWSAGYRRATAPVRP